MTNRPAWRSKATSTSWVFGSRGIGRPSLESRRSVASSVNSAKAYRSEAGINPRRILAEPSGQSGLDPVTFDPIREHICRTHLLARGN